MRNMVLIVGVNGVAGCTKEFMNRNYPSHKPYVLPWLPNDARILQNFFLTARELEDKEIAHHLRGRFTSHRLKLFFDNIWAQHITKHSHNNVAVTSDLGFYDYLEAVKGVPHPFFVLHDDDVVCADHPVLTCGDTHTTYWFMGGVMFTKKMLGLHIAGKTTIDNFIIIQLKEEVLGDLVYNNELLTAVIDSNFTLAAEMQNQQIKVMRFKAIKSDKNA